MATVSDRPVVHLFIGLPKAGTSSLRVLLDWHRDLFAHHGFHIPQAGWTSLIDNHWGCGHNNIAWEIGEIRPIIPEYGGLADLIQEIASLPHREHIVFSEVFSFATETQINRLKEAFSAFDVRVIVFLRNQLDWVESLYTEEQKFFYQSDFREWFLSLATDRFDHHKLLRRWNDAFGPVTTRQYEQIRANITGAFLECCSVPIELQNQLLKRAIPQINPTPGDFPMALIRETSKVAKRIGINPSHFERFTARSLWAAAQETGRFCGKRRYTDRDSAVALRRLMRESNQKLAAEFSIHLEAEYLDPPDLFAIPQVVQQPEEPNLTLSEWAEFIVAFAANLTIESGSRIRKLGDERQRTNSWLLEGAQDLAHNHYPWDASQDRLINDLLVRARALQATALYIEGNENGYTAFAQCAGDFHEICRVSSPRGQAMLSSIRRHAQMNNVAGNSLNEGSLAFDESEETSIFIVEIAPSLGGDVVMIRLRDQPNPATATTTLDLLVGIDLAERILELAAVKRTAIWGYGTDFVQALAYSKELRAAIEDDRLTIFDATFADLEVFRSQIRPPAELAGFRGPIILCSSVAKTRRSMKDAAISMGLSEASLIEIFCEPAKNHPYSTMGRLPEPLQAA